MLRSWFVWLLILPIWLSAEEAWKTKRVADWTDQETKEVLTNSPWAAIVTPTIKKTNQGQQNGHTGGMAGVPGMGRRRMGQDPNATPSATPEMPQPLTIRWESALPIREAELKAHETNAPDVDESHYAVAIYGLSNRMTKDPSGLADHLKGQSTLKREGQKDLKPSHVDVLQREDGLAIVFLFPRSPGLGEKDSTVEFNALVGSFQITQSFHLDQMIYQGKREL